ncbi:DUF3558 family protein [Sciscionella sediminilitoris]|uniref:DUF3558 family protein n=1 Tax=Sciscionella sediminilitoris TaxID=1445613 RepID=UPI0004DF43A0|nr:DUF3558 family protein [Sciscionella sp. SE31]
MNTRKLLGLLPVLALAATLAACGGSPTEGTPNPQANTSEQPSGGAPASGTQQKLLAPPVPKPLNAKPFLSKDQICKIVNGNQAKQLGIESPYLAGPPGADSLSVDCSYGDRGTSGISIGVGFLVANKGGLSDIYKKRSDQKVWEPLTVQEYPAVIIDRDDKTHSGGCMMYLGVTDQLAVQVSYHGGNQDDAKQVCEKDKQLAGMVISNLKLQG